MLNSLVVSVFGLLAAALQPMCAQLFYGTLNGVPGYYSPDQILAGPPRPSSSTAATSAAATIGKTASTIRRPSTRSSSTRSPSTTRATPTSKNLFCIFYANFTVTCKTDCVIGFDRPRVTLSDDPLLSYQDRTCRTEVATDGTKWSMSDGIILAKSSPQSVVATCDFEEWSYFSCEGVVSCRRGSGALGWGMGVGVDCGGGAPWSGRYSGSPTTGFTGRIHAIATAS
ncbi:hypothetical protein BV898_04489 [Hypsibius exemplaris]|uniref:Uncharacterized protein n=1 Tax=Hypsibius exemplaris TaxID=2072580 RepID=A0A1W0X2I8_HYPEX|nr:hypothetical protein BV898_04489 [Hypsibius exemplaris]